MNFNSMLFNIFAVPNHLFLGNRSSCRFIELEIKPCRLGSRIGDMEKLSCSKQQQSHTASARTGYWDFLTTITASKQALAPSLVQLPSMLAPDKRGK